MAASNFGFRRTPDWADYKPLSEYTDAWPQADQALLWKFYEQVTGRPLPPRDQFSTSSCVGQATATAIDLLFGVQIAGLGRPGSITYRVDATSLYAGSRYEYAYQKLGRKIRGKGSHVPYAAEYAIDYGVLLMQEYPEISLSEFNPVLCTAWEKDGVPDYLAPISRQTPVKDYIRVASVDEAVVAITNGWPVVIGCSWGFKSQPARDKDGFLKPKGTWNHAQVFIGVDVMSSRPGLACMNSWGSRWLSNENARLGIPDGAYWIDLDVADDMIKDGEAVALSNVYQLKPQNINYNLL